jgi:hypothetical protein
MVLRCFYKCFRCMFYVSFRRMLKVLHLDVSKVEWVLHLAPSSSSAASPRCLYLLSAPAGHPNQRHRWAPPLPFFSTLTAWRGMVAWQETGRCEWRGRTLLLFHGSVTQADEHTFCYAIPWTTPVAAPGHVLGRMYEVSVEEEGARPNLAASSFPFLFGRCPSLTAGTCSSRLPADRAAPHGRAAGRQQRAICNLYLYLYLIINRQKFSSPNFSLVRPILI